VKAEPSSQLILLEVQRLDLEIERNRHRARTLPETVTVKELSARDAALRDHTTAAATRATDLARAVRKAEADVAQVRARADRDQSLLTSGQVTSPKQLADLEHEVATLARRQSDLEDEELVAMEALETAEAEHTGLVAQAEQVKAELAASVVARDEAVGSLDTQLAELRDLRGTAAAPVPAELLELYTRIRAENGTGAAMVRRGRCEGCQLDLPRGDLDEIAAAAADEVIRCPECRSILIRTSESGL
jgi:predicted  nucleic acid-binding Zn-ribbon protein